MKTDIEYTECPECGHPGKADDQTHYPECGMTAQPAPGGPKTCRYCGYVSDTGEHCTTPGCPGNVAAIEEPAPVGINHAEKLAEALREIILWIDRDNLSGRYITSDIRAALNAYEEGK